MKKIILLVLILAIGFGGRFLFVRYKKFNFSAAIRKGDFQKVQSFVKANNWANIELLNQKSTPLLKASWYGNKRIIEFLIAEGADPKQKNKFGKNSLHNLVETPLVKDEKTIEIAKIFLEHGVNINTVADDGDSLLHAAAWHEKKKTILFLIKKGVKRKKNRIGRLPSETGIDKETQKYLKSWGY